MSSNVLSGLIETLAGPPYNGHADLPVLANHLQLEADDIFHLGESLQLLRFAQLSEGDLVLTEAGKRFANLETDARKRLFAEHLMGYVPVVRLIRRVLDERPSHTAPEARFRNELEDYMSEGRAGGALKTVVSWARYAELFAYDEQSETFSLENPHESQPSSPRTRIPAFARTACRASNRRRKLSARAIAQARGSAGRRCRRSVRPGDSDG